MQRAGAMRRCAKLRSTSSYCSSRVNSSASSERDKAERLLAGACSGFFRLGSEQEAARACLTVAVLLTKAGRRQELHALCSEMAPLMGSENLPRGTRDALAAFREAVEAGCLTPQFAEEIAAFLHQVKLEP